MASLQLAMTFPWTRESVPCATTWLIAVPPKAAIQTIETSVGIGITQVMNSRTVRPRLTRAMNMPMTGDQEIHQAR